MIDELRQSEAIDPSSTEGRTVESLHRSQVVGTVLIAVCLAVGMVLYGRMQTGDFSLVWPWLVGQRVVFQPNEIELGKVEARKSIEKEIRVVNLSGETMTILGSQKSCGCIGLGDFPIEVPPNGEHSLRVRFSTLTEAGSFKHFVKFFTSDGGNRANVISIAGTVE